MGTATTDPGVTPVPEPVPGTTSGASAPTGSDPAPKPAVALVLSLAQLVAEQKASMQSSDWDSLERVLSEMRAVMDAVLASEGGVPGLRRELEQLAAPERDRIDHILREASTDRLVSAELIRLNLHRFNALRAMRAHADGVDGYGKDGRGVAHRMRLSARA